MFNRDTQYCVQNPTSLELQLAKDALLPLRGFSGKSLEMERLEQKRGTNTSS